jgi:hypothetical protein
MYYILKPKINSIYKKSCVVARTQPTNAKPKPSTHFTSFAYELPLPFNSIEKRVREKILLCYFMQIV